MLDQPHRMEVAESAASNLTLCSQINTYPQELNMARNQTTADRRISPYTAPKPASPRQIQRELKLFRRKEIKKAIDRYTRLLCSIGKFSSWDFLEDLAVIGYLKQHVPAAPDFDDDINFYIDFQYALWGLETNLRVTFALRYIWTLRDHEIAHHFHCTRRTILRWTERICEQLYDSLRDYFAHREKELLDILLCRF
jgi:hypothetical protein